MRQPTIAPPRSPINTPNIRFPANATDCHAHVFGPQSRYAYVPNAGYIPPDALPADYVRMLQTLGCQRGVLVQPSVYGTDNTAMLDALRSGLCPLRGIAVVGADISDRELEEMHAAGVRGVRINLGSLTPGLRLSDAPALAARLKPLGWHLQFFMDLRKMPEAAEQLAALDIDIVIDHFAHIDAAAGTKSTPCKALLALLARPNVWAKLIGPYFISRQFPDFTDTIPVVQAVVAAAPDRVVWGTDWPHPSAYDQLPNDGDLPALFAQWVPDEGLRKRILVDNPARLYGF